MNEITRQGLYRFLKEIFLYPLSAFGGISIFHPAAVPSSFIRDTG